MLEMIRAIIRPEKERQVVEALAREGFFALTKMSVFGRGRQKGIQVGSVLYDELPKTLLMMVVPQEDTARVMAVIEREARTGNIGDGKIFVTPVEEAYTIRTGARE